MATHYSCALLGNSLALMTTIFKVIQSYTCLPQCFTQMTGAYRGVLIFSVSVPKNSGWEHGNFCAILSSEICSHHSHLSLCTVKGWSSWKQPACATLLSSTGVESYREGCNCSPLRTLLLQLFVECSRQKPASAAASSCARSYRLLQHTLLGEDSRSHTPNSTTQKQGSPALPEGFVSRDNLLRPCICYSQRSVTTSTATQHFYS